MGEDLRSTLLTICHHVATTSQLVCLKTGLEDWPDGKKNQNAAQQAKKQRHYVAVTLTNEKKMSLVMLMQTEKLQQYYKASRALTNNTLKDGVREKQKVKSPIIRSKPVFFLC